MEKLTTPALQRLLEEIQDAIQKGGSVEQIQSRVELEFLKADAYQFGKRMEDAFKNIFQKVTIGQEKAVNEERPSAARCSSLTIDHQALLTMGYSKVILAKELAKGLGNTDLVNTLYDAQSKIKMVLEACQINVGSYDQLHSQTPISDSQ